MYVIVCNFVTILYVSVKNYNNFNFSVAHQRPCTKLGIIDNQLDCFPSNNIIHR